MSHGKVLTEEEFSRFGSRTRLLHYLELTRARFDLEKHELRILDYGCGRGKYLCYLRRQGYDVFGVDNDWAAVERGADLMRKYGVDVERSVKLVGADGNVPFEGEQFHFVLSNQVLEHVEHLEPTVAEIARLTVSGGVGLHVYTPLRRVVEDHLYMPFIHWLPKTRLRRSAILACVLAGIEPHGWSRARRAAERAEIYYRFSVEQTHFRRPRHVRQVFENSGFKTKCPVLSEPVLSRNSDVLSLNKRLRRWWIVNFRSAVLLTIKD